MRIEILGTMRVEVDGAAVDLGPPKQRALFALLLLNANQVVGTERLIDLMWGDAPPRTAAHSIQIYVSALRKVFSEELIETRAPGYLLRSEPELVDAIRFQHLVEQAGVENLRAALALWSGTPLSEFAYEDWAQPFIRRMEGLHARALEMLAEAELGDGRAAQVPALLEDLIEKEPLREEPRRLLMLALYRTGRQAEALRNFREFRRLVGEELGVEPSFDLAQLEEQILLQDPSLLPPRVAAISGGRVARNPYKGLGAFDEIDAADFFGRDKLVAEMVDALSAGNRLLVVVGPSGSGKSSAVRAGLIPELREGRVAGSDRWILATMTPGRHPFEQLEAALSRVSRSELPAVLEQLIENDTGFLRMALRLVPDEKSEMLLFVDQFEELFTLAPERLRRRFLDNLVTAVTDPRSRVRVVITLRADFYDKPLLSQRFAPVFASSIVNVVPLAPSELEAATLQPAAAVGVDVQPALLAQLVADMGEEAAALPLLQYTLTELFNSRQGGSLNLPDYIAIGGLHGALTARADHLFEGLAETDQELARRILLHLVGVEKGAKATRRRVTLDELRQLGEVDEVLARFISNRLLIADRDPLTGKATIQVTHEALLDGWGRLRSWIELYATDLQRRSIVSAAADEWESSGRDIDYLMTGGRLAQLEEWSRETTLGLTPLEHEYLGASLQQRAITEDEEGVRRQREAVTARRARQRLWGLAAALALLAGTATFAVMAVLPDPLPPIAYLSYGRPEGVDPILDYVAAGYDLAAAEVGDLLAEYPTSDFEALNEVLRLSDAGVDYLLTFRTFGWAVMEAASTFPETNYAVIDWEVTPPTPNALALRFAENEGSFLMGAIAALKSETGVIGFVGGVDMPLIHKFQAGYEAGARHVRPDIEVLVEYLAPAWDFSGFGSGTLAQLKAEPLYQAGADVIFQAAGASGWGVFQAAVLESERQGRHFWAIGVDTDEYHSIPAISPDAFDPNWWQPHILTSMVKRYDVVAHDALTDFAGGRWSPGVREYGLADQGLDYATSGGFIDDIVPVVDDIKAQIISGEIVVPSTVTP